MNPLAKRGGSGELVIANSQPEAYAEKISVEPSTVSSCLATICAVEAHWVLEARETIVQVEVLDRSFHTLKMYHGVSPHLGDEQATQAFSWAKFLENTSGHGRLFFPVQMDWNNFLPPQGCAGHPAEIHRDIWAKASLLGCLSLPGSVVLNPWHHFEGAETQMDCPGTPSGVLADSSAIQGFAKGWFPKGWFWRMFPCSLNGHESTFGCFPVL